MVMINASNTSIDVNLPSGSWHCILDTAQEMGLVSPVAVGQISYHQAANSLSLWVSKID
jgi:hypothetical protein